MKAADVALRHFALRKNAELPFLDTPHMDG